MLNLVQKSLDNLVQKSLKNVKKSLLKLDGLEVLPFFYIRKWENCYGINIIVFNNFRLEIGFIESERIVEVKPQLNTEIDHASLCQFNTAIYKIMLNLEFIILRD
jgi:hypothetical protein